MSSIDVFAIVTAITFFVFAVRDAIKGSWIGLVMLLVAGGGFILFKSATEPFFGFFGLVIFVTAFHYAGLVIILGPVLGSLVFLLDRPARRHW